MTRRPAASPSAARHRTATSRCARSGTSRRDDRHGGGRGSGPPPVLGPRPCGHPAGGARPHRLYWGRVLAATLRMARDVDVAEEATADAFLLALQTWPEHGVPDSVEAWLLTAARRRAIDRIRRLVRLRARVPVLAAS